jgi:hypothetical protein
MEFESLERSEAYSSYITFINYNNRTDVFINNKIFPITSSVGNIYKEHADDDGFLYIEFFEESTFG